MCFSERMNACPKDETCGAPSRAIQDVSQGRWQSCSFENEPFRVLRTCSCVFFGNDPCVVLRTWLGLFFRTNEHVSQGRNSLCFPKRAFQCPESLATGKRFFYSLFPLPIRREVGILSLSHNRGLTSICYTRLNLVELRTRV